MEEKIVFKLVREDQFRLKSADMDLKRWEIEYYRNEWIKPGHKDSYIFAFDSLEAALSFYLTNKNFVDQQYEVWEAKAKEVIPAPEYVVNLIFGAGPKEIKKYWKLFNRGASIEKIKEKVKGVNVRVPDGTVLCREIFLIKRISII
jgi:hypothetical protein